MLPLFPIAFQERGRGEVTTKKCSHCEPFFAVLTNEAVFLFSQYPCLLRKH